MLSQLDAAVTGAPMQQMLDRFGQQTFVGGKRVPIEKVPRLPKQAATSVHRVKVSLYGARPPVWRRIEIPSAMRLDLVHEVMQVAFGLAWLPPARVRDGLRPVRRTGRR